MLSIIRALLLTLLSAALYGCTETRFEDATGKIQLRGINGIVESADVVFLIEERALEQLAYKSATGRQEFDNLSYNFNFDLLIPLEDDRRLSTQFVDTVEDIEYTFVLAGSIASPQILQWERPVRVWEGSETVIEVGAGHAGNTIGEVDVYFAAPGTVPVLGSALGSIDFGGQIADAEFAAGEYEIVLTAKDDPANVLFTSNSVTLAAATSYTIAVFDPDPSLTAPINVRLIPLAGNAIELTDANFPATAQFVNAAFGSGNIDVAADGDFANLLASNLPHGMVSPDVEVASGTTPYAFTPTGNTMPLFEEDLSFLRSTRSTVILLGEVGDLQSLVLPSLRRGFTSAAQIRATNASFNAQSVDIYLTAPGDAIDDRLPNIRALEFDRATGVGQQAAQELEVTVTLNGETTPIVGPLPLTLSLNDIVELVVLDTADPNVADLLIFSNVNP